MEKTHFERAIFFSWYCRIRDCKYCYMSTQPENKKARRSTESLLAEIILCKKLGWKIGFFSGGIGAFSQVEFEELLKNVYTVNGEKVWLNIGALNKEQLKTFLPYAKGVVGSIETVNKKVHDFVCPSKPIEPYLEMFKEAEKLGLLRGITIILGLGENEKDFEALKKMINEYSISKIHFYGLNPQKGTFFENKESPTKKYQAWWIKKTREEFPNINIQCGIWLDRVDRISFLLEAGANSISKFPAIKYFGTKYAEEIEQQCKKAGREFEGTLTKLPKIDAGKEVEKLDLDEELKQKIKIKLEKYLTKMRNNIQHGGK